MAAKINTEKLKQNPVVLNTPLDFLFLNIE